MNIYLGSPAATSAEMIVKSPQRCEVGMQASEHTVLLFFFLSFQKKWFIKAVGVSGNSYDQMTILKLQKLAAGCLQTCAYPKLFTLPAEISNQPNWAKTRCHMQRSVFVYKGVIELLYNQLDVKTQYMCTKREQCRCIWVDVKMRMYIRTPYLSISVICISVFFSFSSKSY